jgi:hypothetical protein
MHLIRYESIPTLFRVKMVCNMQNGMDRKLEREQENIESISCSINSNDIWWSNKAALSELVTWEMFKNGGQSINKTYRGVVEDLRDESKNAPMYIVVPERAPDKYIVCDPNSRAFCFRYAAELCTWLHFFVQRNSRRCTAIEKSSAEESRLIGVHWWSKECDALSEWVDLTLVKLCSAPKNIFPCHRWNNVHAFCSGLSINPFCACAHICRHRIWLRRFAPVHSHAQSRAHIGQMYRVSYIKCSTGKSHD